MSGAGRVRLTDVVEQLRLELTELAESVNKDALTFEVDQVEVELRVAVTVGAEVGAKASFWVFTEATAAASTEREASHSVKLVLKPCAPTGGPVKVGRGG